MAANYQLAFVTPGNKPWCAIFLKQILQRPKSLWYPCGLPQMLHLLCNLTAGISPFIFILLLLPNLLFVHTFEWHTQKS